ncbi:uncharacterized protein PHACADRAFT_202515 [Phanerochaete carnosa HHB-10118-sp]|uniref:Uncharacterized protein n=1 Tax=Phanerochaete carnosa (strain HHB-10118-sp) TaxID=650164 RepID=K5VC69_PHACS|nr:uncharacterized protein PHACADRAFT_202515 [Phanerochaete carnosa HHB-10118-sp]EKM48688.1 hypothetical protein PHACADRAFT_202515 [Phanerochaete carnosa HHB-10118-sp]
MAPRRNKGKKAPPAPRKRTAAPPAPTNDETTPTTASTSSTSQPGPNNDTSSVLSSVSPVPGPTTNNISRPNAIELGNGAQPATAMSSTGAGSQGPHIPDIDPALTGSAPMDPATANLMNQVRLLEERLQRAEAAGPLASGGGDRRAAAAAAGSIPKPKGSAGGGKKGFHLIEKMGLGGSGEGKKLYNQLLSTVRELAHAARLDLSMPYCKVRPQDLHNIFATARKIHPFLARFANDWATGEMLKQFMSSVRRYGKRKGYFLYDTEASDVFRRLDDMEDGE